MTRPDGAAPENAPASDLKETQETVENSVDTAQKPMRDMSPEALNAALDALEADHAALSEKYDQTLRAYADAENRAKRAEKDRADAVKYAPSRIARDLLEPADNLRRALAAAGEKKEDLAQILENLIAGVTLTEKNLYQVFERHNIVKISLQIGDVFDPNLHEAVTRVPLPDKPENTILDILQEGYKIGDRLLRPARVVVTGS